jgi:hypothetical protein
MNWFRNTVGQKETHSKDGLSYIEHTGEHSWTVVWRGEVAMPPLSTRELARKAIRRRKVEPQLVFW